VNLATLIILIIWTLTWKGIALWKAGRKNNLAWFIVLLIINTAGILEILYIFCFSEMKQKQAVKVVSKKRR